MGLAIIIALAASTAIGLLNGFMVSTIGIPALIATFATQTAFSGIALILCNGQPINGFTETFKVFGQGKIGPVPVPVIIMALCFALGAFILDKTYFGRYFYAVGGKAFRYPYWKGKISGICVVRLLCGTCRTGAPVTYQLWYGQCRTWI